MKYITHLSRTLVGVLFVVSGFIKLNDPVGFSFKLEEYFSAGVLDLPVLMPFALAIAFFVVVFEVLLGLFLLLGYQLKFTLWSLLSMIVFFTFLTFYSAYFNKVTDCGCFGDAIKLTPWESFTKDIILLILILVLFAGKKYLNTLLPKSLTKGVVILSFLGAVSFGFWVLQHLPAIDFRPYKIGVHIPSGMSVPENAPKSIYEYQWVFEVNGTEKVITTQKEYPNVAGTFLRVSTKKIQEGYVPPIHDFTIEQDGVDQTESLMMVPKLVMVVAYDLAKSNPQAFEKVAQATLKAHNAGYEVIGMSASSEAQAAEVIEKYGLGFDFYFTDQTTLKTIVRSNPAILVVEHGTIIQKRHYNDFELLEFNTTN
jgi:uncharacterized membrane protein YphA (DoxX/SURF4 family)/peroxiredoxin